MAWTREGRVTHWKSSKGIFKLWTIMKRNSMNGFKMCADLFRTICGIIRKIKIYMKKVALFTH